MPDTLTPTGDRVPGAPSMATAARAEPASAHRARMVTLQAFVALADYTLDARRNPIPGPACDALIRHLIEAEMATVQTLERADGSTVRRLDLHGVTVWATGSAYALLTNWRNEAARRIGAMCNA